MDNTLLDISEPCTHRNWWSIMEDTVEEEDERDVWPYPDWDPFDSDEGDNMDLLNGLVDGKLVRMTDTEAYRLSSFCHYRGITDRLRIAVLLNPHHCEELHRFRLFAGHEMEEVEEKARVCQSKFLSCELSMEDFMWCREKANGEVPYSYSLACDCPPQCFLSMMKNICFREILPMLEKRRGALVELTNRYLLDREEVECGGVAVLVEEFFQRLGISNYKLVPRPDLRHVGERLMKCSSYPSRANFGLLLWHCKRRSTLVVEPAEVGAPCKLPKCPDQTRALSTK